MSYANGTQFYNLPQTVGTDKRDWFDTNSAFAAIDAALHSAVTGQASDAEAIATINGKLADDEADIAALQTKTTTHDSQIAALQTTVNTQASQIQDVRQDAEDMITANNEGAAATSTRAYAIGDYFIYNDVLYKATAAIAIGDTIVPNTNCEATNIDTELTQVNSDLEGKIVATATADGVKTWSQIYDSIYSSIAAIANKRGLSLEVIGNSGELSYYPIQGFANNVASFGRLWGVCYIDLINIKSTDSERTTVEFAIDGTVVRSSTIATSVPAAGIKLNVIAFN